MLYLHNSLTGKKEAFVPIEPGKVGIYACGITVYDYCHLGHARTMVGFDMIVRYLRFLGYEVTFVRNITDIDDKIIVRANELQIPFDELTEKFITAMHEDERALNILPPDHEPRATGLGQMDYVIKLIERLIAKEVAYVAGNGDVYFEVARFKEYGKLSNKELDKLISGARIEINKEKRSPLDFVLWKSAKEGEPSWLSPWGAGRPGWHIECSAMSMHALGEHFDIHGGGLDLQFPHHENEIAQSEAATDKTFANYWLHVGLLQINNEKMAKSLGNFFTIQEMLKKHHPEVLRYFLLSSHYRSPLNYSEENILNAQKALIRLYQSLKGFSIEKEAELPLSEKWVNLFNEAMNDDFNTPEAIAHLFTLSHELNKTGDQTLAFTLKKLGAVLGILQSVPEHFLQTSNSESELDTSKIDNLIQERLQARSEKNWQRADEIRQTLFEMGVELEDSSDVTTWRART